MMAVATKMAIAVTVLRMRLEDRYAVMSNDSKA